VIDHGFIHSIYSFDPNNIPIEFSAPNEKINLRKRPQMRDKEPLTEALKGPEMQPDVWPNPKSPTPAADRMVYPGEGTIFSDRQD
jgi:hypothetical protein